MLDWRNDFIMCILEMKKIAVFVDVQNIYYTTKQAYGGSFNYRELWRRVNELGQIVIANAYAIDSNDDGQKRFQTALRSIGFEVKLKPFIQRQDGSAKGDWDVGITIDVLESATEVDHVVLLTGDGDFALLLDKITSDYQVKTCVFGVESLTARGSIKSCDAFYPIEQDLLL